MPITIPNTFTASTVILSAEVNENFTALASQAVAKSGDTMTGNLTVPGLSVTNTSTSSAVSATLGSLVTLTVSSTSASAIDVAGGINAGTGNVGIIGTDGRIPEISSTYFASLSAANLEGVSGEADQIVLGVQIFS